LDRLLDALWPEEIDRSDTRAVDACVHRLRERIAPDPANPRYIQTVRGLGYALRVPKDSTKSPLICR
jgi:DNA-binding response OmpR family regulator